MFGIARGRGQRGERAPGQVPARPRGDALPRRDRRHADRASGEAAAGPPGQGGPARGRSARARRHPRDHGHQLRPRPQRSRRASSGATSTTAWPASSCGCRPCASAATTCPVSSRPSARPSRARSGRRSRGITAPALRALAPHSWPGNVRELEHEMRRLAYVCPEGEAIEPGMLSEHILLAPADEAGDPPSSLRSRTTWTTSSAGSSAPPWCAPRDAAPPRPGCSASRATASPSRWAARPGGLLKARTRRAPCGALRLGLDLGRGPVGPLGRPDGGRDAPGGGAGGRLPRPSHLGERPGAAQGHGGRPRRQVSQRGPGEADRSSKSPCPPSRSWTSRRGQQAKLAEGPRGRGLGGGSPLGLTFPVDPDDCDVDSSNFCSRGEALLGSSLVFGTVGVVIGRASCRASSGPPSLWGRGPAPPPAAGPAGSRWRSA